MAFTSHADTAHATTHVPSALQVPEVDERLTYIESGNAVLDTLLRMTGRKEKVGNPQYTVQEVAPLKERAVSDAADNSSATTLDFADVSHMIARQVWENMDTGERVFFSKSAAVGSGQVTNCIRAWHDTTAAAISVGDRWKLISTEYEEGDGVSDSRTRERNSHINYVGGIEHVFEVTEESMFLNTFGPDEMTVQDTLGIRDFRKMRNKALLLSNPDATTSGTGITTTVWSTGGLRYWAKKYNNIDIGPGATRLSLARGAQKIAEHSGELQQNFVAICSQNVWAHISEMDATFRRTSREDKTIGFIVNEIEYPGGKITLAVDHTMNEPNLDSELLLFNPDKLSIATFVPLTVRRGVETPGSHTRKVQMYVREGLKVHAPLMTGRLFNFQYAA